MRICSLLDGTSETESNQVFILATNSGLRNRCNLAENSMRPVAIERRNWIHIGNPRQDRRSRRSFGGGELPRRLKLSVRDHLVAVLPGFADAPIQPLPHLTPAAWVDRY